MCKKLRLLTLYLANNVLCIPMVFPTGGGSIAALSANIFVAVLNDGFYSFKEEAASAKFLTVLNLITLAFYFTYFTNLISISTLSIIATKIPWINIIVNLYLVFFEDHEWNSVSCKMAMFDIVLGLINLALLIRYKQSMQIYHPIITSVLFWLCMIIYCLKNIWLTYHNISRNCESMPNTRHNPPNSKVEDTAGIKVPTDSPRTKCRAQTFDLQHTSDTEPTVVNKSSAFEPPQQKVTNVAEGHASQALVQQPSLPSTNAGDLPSADPVNSSASTRQPTAAMASKVTKGKKLSSLPPEPTHGSDLPPGLPKQSKPASGGADSSAQGSQPASGGGASSSTPVIEKADHTLRVKYIPIYYILEACQFRWDWKDDNYNLGSVIECCSYEVDITITGSFLDIVEITKITKTYKGQIKREVLERDSKECEAYSNPWMTFPKAIQDGLNRQLQFQGPLICIGSTFVYPGSFKYTIEGSNELYTYKMVSTEFSDSKHKTDTLPLKINAEFGNDSLTRGQKILLMTFGFYFLKWWSMFYTVQLKKSQIALKFGEIDIICEMQLLYFQIIHQGKEYILKEINEKAELAVFECLEDGTKKPLSHIPSITTQPTPQPASGGADSPAQGSQLASGGGASSSTSVIEKADYTLQIKYVKIDTLRGACKFCWHLQSCNLFGDPDAYARRCYYEVKVNSTNKVSSIAIVKKTSAVISKRSLRSKGKWDQVQKAIEDGLKHQLPLKEIKYPLICMGSNFAYPGSFQYTIKGSDKFYTYKMQDTQFSDDLDGDEDIPLKINAEFGNNALTQIQKLLLMMFGLYFCKWCKMLRKVELGFDTSVFPECLYVNLNGLDIECRGGYLDECSLIIKYQAKDYYLKEIEERDGEVRLILIEHKQTESRFSHENIEHVIPLQLSSLPPEPNHESDLPPGLPKQSEPASGGALQQQNLQQGSQPASGGALQQQNLQQRPQLASGGGASSTPVTPKPQCYQFTPQFAAVCKHIDEEGSKNRENPYLKVIDSNEFKVIAMIIDTTNYFTVRIKYLHTDHVVGVSKFMWYGRNDIGENYAIFQSDSYHNYEVDVVASFFKAKIAKIVKIVEKVGSEERVVLKGGIIRGKLQEAIQDGRQLKFEDPLIFVGSGSTFVYPGSFDYTIGGSVYTYKMVSTEFSDLKDPDCKDPLPLKINVEFGNNGLDREQKILLMMLGFHFLRLPKMLKKVQFKGYGYNIALTFGEIDIECTCVNAQYLSIIYKGKEYILKEINKKAGLVAFECREDDSDSDYYIPTTINQPTSKPASSSGSTDSPAPTPQPASGSTDSPAPTPQPASGGALQQQNLQQGSQPASGGGASSTSVTPKPQCYQFTPQFAAVCKHIDEEGSKNRENPFLKGIITSVIEKENYTLRVKYIPMEYRFEACQFKWGSKDDNYTLLGSVIAECSHEVDITGSFFLGDIVKIIGSFLVDIVKITKITKTYKGQIHREVLEQDSKEWTPYSKPWRTFPKAIQDGLKHQLQFQGPLICIGSIFAYSGSFDYTIEGSNELYTYKMVSTEFSDSKHETDPLPLKINAEFGNNALTTIQKILLMMFGFYFLKWWSMFEKVQLKKSQIALKFGEIDIICASLDPYFQIIHQGKEYILKEINEKAELAVFECLGDGTTKPLSHIPSITTQSTSKPASSSGSADSPAPTPQPAYGGALQQQNPQQGPQLASGSADSPAPTPELASGGGASSTPVKLKVCPFMPELADASQLKAVCRNIGQGDSRIAKDILLETLFKTFRKLNLRSIITLAIKYIPTDYFVFKACKFQWGSKDDNYNLLGSTKEEGSYKVKYIIIGGIMDIGPLGGIMDIMDIIGSFLLPRLSITKIEKTEEGQIQKKVLNQDSQISANFKKAIEDALKHQLPLKEIEYPLICVGSTFAYPDSFQYTIKGSDELYTYEMLSTEFPDDLDGDKDIPLKINAEFGNNALTQMQKLLLMMFGFRFLKWRRMLEKVEFDTSSDFGCLYVNFNGFDIECRTHEYAHKRSLDITLDIKYKDKKGVLKDIEEIDGEVKLAVLQQKISKHKSTMVKHII